MEFMSAILELWTWLTSPAVIPWAGAIAAIIAALTLAPKSWLTSPWEFVSRALWVTIVWLVVAWLLGSLARLGTGAGEGAGDGSEVGPSNNTPPVEVGPNGPLPAMPEHVDVVVIFVPSPAGSSSALEFCCDLHVRKAEGEPTKVAIRARNMQEFEKLLVQELRSLSVPQPPDGLTFLIRRSPFPGESVLRRIVIMVRSLLPDATVILDE